MKEYIMVITDTPFINPWDRHSTIGTLPVQVPLDELCMSMLADGSLRIFKEKKVVKPVKPEMIK
jgi:hypothetical protein